MASTDSSLLESPENLLEPTHDTLIAAPEKKVAKKKKTSKKNIVPSDHLLESEHDMLLPSQTTDNPL
ncbi:MAG: hypothetical protein WCK88_05870 [bacterium]